MKEERWTAFSGCSHDHSENFLYVFRLSFGGAAWPKPDATTEARLRLGLID